MTLVTSSLGCLLLSLCCVVAGTFRTSSPHLKKLDTQGSQLGTIAGRYLNTWVHVWFSGWLEGSDGLQQRGAWNTVKYISTAQGGPRGSWTDLTTMPTVSPLGEPSHLGGSGVGPWTPREPRGPHCSAFPVCLPVYPSFEMFFLFSAVSPLLLKWLNRRKALPDNMNKDFLL